MQTKSVEYAYPTSITAANAGYNTTGCWFVAIFPSESATNESIVYYTDNKIEAENHAAVLPYNYNWMVIYLRKIRLMRLKEKYRGIV